VDFVATGAAPGEPIQYQYWLQGADAKWSSPTTERSVSYAGLASGQFRFLVRAVGAAGTAATAGLAFEVLPPVWRRWWFLTPAIAMLCGLVWFAHRYDLARRLEVERLRLRISRDLHDDLGADLSRVAILSELVARQTERGPQEASRLLTEIADLARGMVDGLGDLVWAMDPQRDDLPSIARRIRRYASDVLESQGIRWSLDTPQDGELAPFPPDKRRHLLLIFQEAIRNAARHSGAKQVRLSLEVEGGEGVARIADDGCGLPDPRPDSGNGLRNLGARAAALGGTLSMESVRGEGVRVTVRFPISRARGRLGRMRMLFRRSPKTSVNR
jgi:signal transduction histidine kinase